MSHRLLKWKYMILVEILGLCITPQASLSQAGQGASKAAVESDWTEVINKSMPAVVSIVSYENGQPHATGSGFLVASDGVIVTNHHVIREGNAARVITKNGDRYEVKGVIDYDVLKDFAILKIAAFDLPTLPLGNSNNLQLGEGVLAIGDPVDELGKMYPATVAVGIISAKPRQEEGSTWIQSTTPVTHGHSGGPLVNRSGEVIGVISRGTTRDAEVFNRAVPINYIRGAIRMGLSIKHTLAEVETEWKELLRAEAADEAKREADQFERAFAIYNDPAGVFTLRRPSEWKVKRSVTTLPNNSTEIKTIFHPATATVADLNGYLSEGLAIDIIIPPRNSYFTPEQLNAGLSQFGEYALRANPGFELTNTGMYIINDMSAKVYTIDGRNPKMPEGERNIFYVFGNQNAVVLINIVEPDSQTKFVQPLVDICAKTFQINLKSNTPASNLDSGENLALTQSAPGASLKSIELSFRSNLPDDTIRLASAFLKTSPNNPDANAYLGLSLLAKRDVDNAVLFLGRAILLGQQITLPVKRLREPLIGHSLEDALVVLSKDGLTVTLGRTSYLATFSSLSNSVLTNYKNQCAVAFLEGSFSEIKLNSEKAKLEKKKFNMFPPNSRLQAFQQGQMVINYAACDAQNLNTTAIIKLIVRLGSQAL